MRGITTALVFMVVVASLSGCERYALDRKMEELCKKDGGIKVYEKVTLSPTEYDAVFNYVVKHKTQEDYYGPGYRYVYRRDYIVGKDAKPERGEGRLSRSYWALYRQFDGRLLGESVSYSRGGGDWITFGFQPSSNHCPKPRIDLAKSVILKGE